jgi:hypothetical protein
MLVPFALAVSATVADVESEADTSKKHHLFRPVPRSAMRDMSTDRPDRTESAYSLDAGHLQVELDAVAFTRDRSDEDRFEGLSLVIPNLKVGLTPRADLQVVLQTWSREQITAPESPRVERSGFGDVTTRLKVNLWGNDGGTTAMAVMPFVTWPTSQDQLGSEKVEGGLIVPLAVALPREWGLGVMAQVNLHRHSGGEDEVEWVASATAAHDVIGSLGGFVELFGAYANAPGADWTGTFDAGLTYALGRDVMVDAGFYAGLTSATEDLTLFVGMSLRR